MSKFPYSSATSPVETPKSYHLKFWLYRAVFVLLFSLAGFFQSIDAGQTHTVDQMDTYGNVTHYIHDEQERLLEVVYPTVITAVNLDETQTTQFRETFTYDKNGNLIEHCDANGDITVATYNDQGSPLVIQYPDGTKELFTYFEDGSPQSNTNRSGIRREYRRDGYGNLAEIWMIDRDGNDKCICLDESFAETFQKNPPPQPPIVNACGCDREVYSEDLCTTNELGQHVRQLKITGDTSTSTYTFNAMGRLETKTVEDFEGTLLAKETFLYDGNGNCTLWKQESDQETTNVRNYFGPCSRIETSIENFGLPDETTTNYLYNEYGEPIWTDSVKNLDNSQGTVCTDLDASTSTDESPTYSNISSNSYNEKALEKSIDAFIDSVSDIPSIPSSIVNWLKTPNPSDPEDKREVSWLRWALNHFLRWKEKNELGTIGKGELGNHVRITYINGMLNSSEEVINYLKHLSKIHGDANIHYVFRESDGFIKDVLKAGLIKAGYVSDHAKELVRIWKEMIGEMGGIDGGGTIIHYAHSLGAADTYVAGGLLTEEERQMIKVSTFGSPQIIPQGFFGDATNYISRWDGVCLLGPYNFIKALLLKEPHVIYLRSSEGFPWQDHPISCASYNKIMLGLSSGIVTHFGPLVVNQQPVKN